MKNELTYRFAAKALGAVSALALATSAHADTSTLDLTPLTNTFTSAPIVTALLAVAGVLGVIYGAVKGVKIVLSMWRS